MSQELCGWLPDPEGCDRYQSTLKYPQAEPPWGDEKVDTDLLKALFAVRPNYRRGRQAIGDCVSWGAELAMTILLAQQAMLGEIRFEAEVATEPIYGGSRVERNRGRSPLSGDGSNGSWAADWLMKWGVLPRLDYSKQTGNPEHDLRAYSGSKARDWGATGCGGRQDDPRGEGALDKLARLHPAKGVTRVTEVMQAARLIQSGCPVTVASGVGYNGMRRDARGIVRRNGSWPHQMVFVGVIWINGEPYLILAQSWACSASGPHPYTTSEAEACFTWLVTPEDANAMLKQGDSWAFSRVDGFPRVELDFLKAFGGLAG